MNENVPRPKSTQPQQPTHAQPARAPSTQAHSKNAQQPRSEQTAVDTSTSIAGKLWKRLDGPWGAALAAAILLAPFLNKPFHIDDTVFIRQAEQIRKEPLRPYNFGYNWDYQPLSLWSVSQHPPVVCYLIAGFSLVGGFDEWNLHLGFLPIAAGCAALAYSLAARFCKYPMLASVATTVTPAFLVCSASVMADIPMIFFWLLAVWCAVRYAETSSGWWLWGAGAAASLSAMTKYFAIALVPLLVVYAFPIAGWRKLYRLLPLLLPVAVLAAWGYYSYVETDGVLIHPLSAAKYARESRVSGQFQRTQEMSHVFSFLGGTLLWPVFVLPLLVRLTRWTWSLVVIAAFFLVNSEIVVQKGVAASRNMSFDMSAWLIAYFAILVVAGLSVTLLAADCVIRRRDWNTVLLGLWSFGTLVFCLFLNWTVNARIFLPAAFPLAVLLVRRMEIHPKSVTLIGWCRWALVPVLLISFLVGLADQQHARAGRDFARSAFMHRALRQRPVYFAGHWGFQYYMEQAGARPVDYSSLDLRPGTLIVYPAVNSAVRRVYAEPYLEQRTVHDTSDSYRNPYRVHLMGLRPRAGFHSSVFGNVPYVFLGTPYIDRFVVNECIPGRDARGRQSPPQPTPRPSN